MTEALALAEAGGFIRPFVDLGPQMADLLKRLQKQNVAVDYIESILAAFRDDEHKPAPDTNDPESPPPTHPLIPPSAFPLPPSRTSRPLVDPLTSRELDVLDLLAQRLSNKEIAEKMFISTTTVKGHLQNIYGKLNVSKRREAVEKAMKIGILSEGM